MTAREVTSTAIIGWSQHQRFYYGVRFAKDAHVSDLWNTYFTSSKIVAKFRCSHGEPDVIQIRKVLASKEKALLWEAKVLRRLKIRNKEKWLNIASIPKHWFQNYNEPSNKGKPMSSEQKQKISETRKKLGLGKRDTKHLKPQYGDVNIMRNQDFVAEYKKKITGRKIAIRSDGTRYWSYPDK